LRLLGGLEKGNIVLTYTGSSTIFPAVFLGILCAGGVFTGSNPGFTARELSNQVRDSDAKIILTDIERLQVVLSVAQELRIPKDSIILLGNDREAASNAGHKCLGDLIACGEMDWERVNKQSDLTNRLAVITYSSGTTGLPKGCMISHSNLVSNCEQLVQLDKRSIERQKLAGQAPSEEVLCAFVPLYHAMGLIGYCLVPVKKASTTYIMPSYTLPKLLQVIARFRITDLRLVPPVAVQLIKSASMRNIDLSSIRSVSCGAAPLGAKTALELEGLFRAKNVKVKQGWGMSEATCGVTLFERDEYDPELDGVGFLLPNMEAKVICDDGKEVGYETRGEAFIRGPNIFMGYWKNDEATRSVLSPDGWLSTGDYVAVKPTGIFTVLDRKKELIKVKGFQVAPSELESTLLEYGSIKDCAVIRVIRDGMEHPQAHVVPNRADLTEADVLAFMDSKLARYKRLTGGVIFTDVIPKSPSGKILRRLIKDPFAITARL